MSLCVGTLPSTFFFFLIYYVLPACGGKRFRSDSLTGRADLGKPGAAEHTMVDIQRPGDHTHTHTQLWLVLSILTLSLCGPAALPEKSCQKSLARSPARNVKIRVWISKLISAPCVVRSMSFWWRKTYLPGSVYRLPGSHKDDDGDSDSSSSSSEWLLLFPQLASGRINFVAI